MRLFNPALAIILAAVAPLAVGAPARALEYTVQQWPQDIGKVPCDAWRKNPDGTWSQVATIRASGQTITGRSFKSDSGEARMFSAKCRQ